MTAYLPFQSTLPVWGATGARRPLGRVALISIHAPRVGSDRQRGLPRDPPHISIHAPRVGSDSTPAPFMPGVWIFQSTLPVWGTTGAAPPDLSSTGLFQSTLPVWGATQLQVVGRVLGVISIHAPRVGSDVLPRSTELGDTLFQSTLPVWGATAVERTIRTDEAISIHAPRVGSDRADSRFQPARNNFNPRSPCGERP